MFNRIQCFYVSYGVIDESNMAYSSLQILTDYVDKDTQVGQQVTKISILCEDGDFTLSKRIQGEIQGHMLAGGTLPMDLDVQLGSIVKKGNFSQAIKGFKSVDSFSNEFTHERGTGSDKSSKSSQSKVG
ncbi:hypothetical protein HWQ46_00350 [Shewanella sp. D64]|uniref:hypothetical protein n=1 Tax=unclassified Shewanella TaxID=196818 RepID=UPI0022BA59FB|nr:MULTISPECIES: hypothetical protein [unclassified Shewanella]MEC4724002.1 hypothetical protein [Shewanella sp. D64]MEC4736022.1 hypothetical protein [Shewanella sp. E94]WBJ98033.1 hypothetical protein HWQ47_13510 [Shewanella sp. MTB7]WBJ98043.1 hypothetical protein HWQ47_13560 [Shewanella sp. MTB7]